MHARDFTLQYVTDRHVRMDQWYVTVSYITLRYVRVENRHKSLALSRISPRVRVWVSVSIVYRIATGGYSWIWPNLLIIYIYTKVPTLCD